MTGQEQDREALARVIGEKDHRLGSQVSWGSVWRHYADAVLASDWLARVRAEDAEDAWEQGYSAGQTDQLRHGERPAGRRNPYRHTAAAADPSPEASGA